MNPILNQNDSYECIEFLNNLVSMNFVIVDVETTGGSPKSSKITELAMYKHDGNEIIDEYSSLINPEQDIPEFIVRLTGITNDHVKNAPKFFEVAKEVIDFFEDSIFVAHNVSFDYGMFRSEFKTLGYDFRKPHLCTVVASRQIIPGYESYSLGKLSRQIGIQIENRHRAGGDALATTKLFDILYKKDKSSLSSLIKQELNPKSVHPNLDINTVDALPNKTGVYKFFNEFNQIIYIGKSVQIKNRVEQHLRNNKSAKGIRMIEEISKIEYELTGSGLIALLLESEQIKEHQPKFNRKLRKSKFPFGLFDNLNAQGYIELNIESIGKNENIPLLHFSTKKEGVSYLRNLVETHTLCQKLCGLYSSKTSCFQYEIDACNGACIEAEKASDYNNRIQSYIETLQYNGRSFMILERGRERNEKSIVLIKNGIYQGYCYAPYQYYTKSIEQLNDILLFKKEDRDVRSIVNSYLRNSKKHKIIEFSENI